VTAKQRVLVVDGLSETEEVLRAVLEPRGLSVDRIRSSVAENFSAERRPSVMVLHVDEEPPPAAAPAGWRDVPRIFIGTARFGAGKLDGPPNTGSPKLGGCDADAHYLEQPFQYGELIRTIERLLAKAG
jgi:CheY-like chemotaxis protein